MLYAPQFLRRTRSHPARGFTLIELTVVIAMLVVFGGVAIIFLGGGADEAEAIRYIARQVSGTMEGAQRQAGMSGDIAVIEYDFDNQSVALYLPKDAKSEDFEPSDDEYANLELISAFGVGDPGDPQASKVWLESVQTYDGDITNKGILNIDVKPTGTAIGHVVNLVTRSGERISVELNPMSGVAHSYIGGKTIEKPEKDPAQ